MAAAVRLIDLGSLRVGDRRHTTTTGNRGLTTLLCRHVACAGEVVTLDFIGKSGQPWHVQIRDELLAATLRGMSDGRSERAVSHVANRLGNTAAVARQNYISPRIIELYRAGSVLDLSRPSIRALRELLEDS